MKKITPTYSALLIGLLSLQSAQAQINSEQVQLTKQVLTFGDWYDAGADLGIDTDNLPTKIEDRYYDKNGNLARVTEGTFMLGDSETTRVEVEKFGDIKLDTYRSYLYDQNNRLTHVTERKYKALNGWYYSWAASDTIQTYTYNEEGKMSGQSNQNYRFEYIWEGNHIAIEKKYNKYSGKISSTTHYSNFVDDERNLAQKVVEVSSYSKYYIENEYNEKGQLTKTTYYELAEPVTNEQGEIIDGTKGNPTKQIERTYEGEREVLTLTYNWNKKTEAFTQVSKKEVKLNEVRGGYETTNYSYSNGEWFKNGSTKVTVDAQYDTTTPVANISVEPCGPRANSVEVKFKVPQGAENIKKWNVYRNGSLLGEANLDQGSYTFQDKEVLNGTYDYYVLADTIGSKGEKFISNIVSQEYNTPLDTVSNIRIVESGKKTVGSITKPQTVYVYSLAWDAPKTSNTILGYNVYLNPSPYAKNPSPYNEQLITNPYVELELKDPDKLENIIQVEIVYRIGFAKTSKQVIKLDKNNDINENKITKVSKIVTFGDAMGGTAQTQATKEDVSYYDANNNVVMKVTNSYLYDDDPNTPEVEKPGDLVPTTYTVYDYDSQNRLVGERSRKYGFYSGYDQAWAEDFKQEASYAYDETTGKLIEMNDGSKIYRYEWEGDNIVKETVSVAGSDKALYTVAYSNFAASGKNLPQYGFSLSTDPSSDYNNIISEYEYDAQGRKTAQRNYKFGNNIERDENGVIIKADKGTPINEQLWIYEKDHLKTYLKNNWSSKNQELAPNTKKEYTVVSGGLREESYSYMNYGQYKGWTKNATYTETQNALLYGKTAPTDLKVTEVEGKVNSIRLEAKAPAKTYGEPVTYDVYKNGKKVGEAKPDGAGNLTYEEEEVMNGTWHYFIKPSTPFGSIDVQTTNVVEKVFNTELLPAQNIAFPVNGINENGDYVLKVTWEAPQTDLKIKGYNIFTDIKSWTKNPTPVNGIEILPIDSTAYLFEWPKTTKKEKTVCVEVVYNIGKVKSENLPVSLQSIPVGIMTTETSQQLTFAGNRVYINGNYEQLDVFALNGAHLVQHAGTKEVDLGHLPVGVYVIKLKTAQGIESLKIVKK